MPTKHVNFLPDILNAMRNGRTVGIIDMQGTSHFCHVQGIRKEGGKDIWLVQPFSGKEICCRAA